MKLVILLDFLLIVFCSCQKEYSIMTNSGRKIVLNGLITTDSLLSVTISKSSEMSDTSFLVDGLLSSALVVIKKDNKVIDSLFYTSNRDVQLNAGVFVKSNYSSKKLFPLSGFEYEITVKVAGLPDITSKTTIPSIIKIEKVDTTRIKLTNVQPGLSNVKFVCDIEFTDPKPEKNYYLLFICRSPKFAVNSGNISFSCSDPIVEEQLCMGSMQGVAFSDNIINGQTHRLKVGIEGNEIGYPFRELDIFLSHRKVIYFRLLSITEDYFKYIQTLNLFNKNYHNPLAEPTQVFSNIQGGYGIFAGAAVSTDSLVFTY